MTTARFDSGDPRVDTALAELAATDPDTADRAAEAFAGLTLGSGLRSVSLRSLQDYLWYQPPYKHDQLSDEQRATTDALAPVRQAGPASVRRHLPRPDHRPSACRVRRR